MIVTVVAAVPPAAFAPPLGRPLHYVVTETFAGGGPARLVRRETLRFEPGVATLTLTDVAIEAPPAAKAALERLLRPLVGVETRVALAADGAVGAPIDAERAWAAFLASRRALDARVAASGDAGAPAGRAALAAEMDPAHRDDRLREPFLLLLPPALPPLGPGETRALAAPGAPLVPSSAVRLIAVEPGLLRYRVTVAAAARPFAETTELAIARATGLVARAVTVRAIVAADGARRVVSTRETALEP